MVRIGVVNIDTSHPMAFAEYLMKTDRARYVAIYNDGFREDDEVEAFVKNNGLEKRCSSLEELADYVDVGFIQGCNWNKHIEYALPFFRKGKPVFIDKPIVGSISDCKVLEKLVLQGNVILGSSSARYAEEIATFIGRPEEERGKVLNIYGTSGVDEFNYSIHIVEAIGGIVGTGAISVKFMGRSEMDGKRCENFLIRFANGVTAIYSSFHGAWMPFDIVVMTTKAIHSFRIDSSKIYGALLDRICSIMETGKNELAPVNALTESVKIMLAGRISREKDGAEVMLADIPEGDPGYDGEAFEKEYAAKATKIYL